MRGFHFLLIALVAGCSERSDSDSDPAEGCAAEGIAIGETQSAVLTQRILGGWVVSGASGHLAMYESQRVRLFGPGDEGLLWFEDYNDGGHDVFIALDADGAVYRGKTQMDGSTLLFKRTADGQVVWSSAFRPASGEMQVAGLVIDIEGSLWLLLDSRDAVDLGGGPVGAPSETDVGIWSRFDLDGNYLAGAVIDGDFRGRGAAAWVDRAGLVAHIERDGQQQLVAIDRDGGEEWRLDDVSLTAPFALHEGGEVSIDISGDLVRFGPDQSERWRADVWSDEIVRDMIALADGHVVGLSSTFIETESDTAYVYLRLVSPAGEQLASECFTRDIELAHGPDLAHYFFHTDVGDDLDLHDWRVDEPGDYMVTRSAP